MCVMSMVMDAMYDDWLERWAKEKKWEWNIKPSTLPPIPFPSQEDLALFYKLLERAKKYDEEHNQPDCELEEKKNKLKELAKEMGIEISFP